MKRSFKETVKRVWCLIMICALVVNTYPLQTVAEETEDTVENTDGVNTTEEKDEVDSASLDSDNQSKPEEDKNPEQEDESEDEKKSESEENTENAENTDNTEEVSETEDNTESSTESETEMSTEESTQEEAESNTEEETSKGIMLLNIDNTLEVIISGVSIAAQGEPVYVSTQDGSDRHFEISVKAGAQAKYEGQAPEEELVAERERLASCYSVELTMKTPSEEEQSLGTSSLSVAEDGTITIADINSDNIKLTETGEYQWHVGVYKDGEEVTGETISKSITIPQAISAEVTLNTIDVAEYEKRMDGQLCNGFFVPYTASVSVTLKGIGNEVSASSRRNEIAYCLSQYEFSVLRETEETDPVVMNQKTLDIDSLIDAFINSNGTCQTHIIHDKEVIESVGQYSFYAKLNDTVSEKKIVDISLLEQGMEYAPNVVKDYYEYDESIIFSLAKGVTAGEVECYESNATGEKKNTSNLIIRQKEQNVYEVVGNRMTGEDDTPFYVTFKHTGNEFYQEAVQTYPIKIKKVALTGDIAIRELVERKFFFKTRKMVVDVTFSANNHDALLNADYTKIEFELFIKNGDTSEKMDIKKVTKSMSDGKITFTYEVDDKFSKKLKSDGIYTVEAIADYSAFDSVYYEDLELSTEKLQVKPNILTIKAQDNLEVEYNKKDDNKLQFEITGENLDQSQIAWTITVEDPSIIEMDNDGNYKTLKGGTTNLIITVDDSTEYDIYEEQSKTIAVTVLSPANTDYTLNGENPNTFLNNPKAMVVGEDNEKERWYDTDITLSFGENNLYDELYYSVDGGSHWTHVNDREFTINESMPTDYLFYFCDTEANIYSCILEGKTIISGNLEQMKGVAVDKTNPIWNTVLISDQEPSVHSTDKISYFPTEIVLTAYAGDKQGCGQIVDSGSGISKVFVQYDNSGKWEEVKDFTADQRYCNSYCITLSDNKNYGTIKLKVVDYLGHESEIAEYAKAVCIDDENPVVVAIAVNADGEENHYSGSWTNQQLRYSIGLKDSKEQISGIYSYEYIFVSRGEKVDFTKTAWNKISKDELMLVFGEEWNQTQQTKEGSFLYQTDRTKKSADDVKAQFAQMNGTLYVRAESNAGLVTTEEDIRENEQPIRIWQEELDVAKVIASNKCDEDTGWYNKETGSVTISFEYPVYNEANYAPAVGIIYTYSTKTDEEDFYTSRTRSFYKGIIDEESGKVIEVSDYQNANTVVSLADDGIIPINTDSINELSVYVEDAAGNKSDITTFEVKADFIEPQIVKASFDGESQTLHMDSKESIVYEKFSQSTVIVSAEAEYGISKKQNFYMAVTKDQGGKEALTGSNARESLNMEPCTRGIVYLCAIDGAGNKSEAWTNGVVVDNLSPTGGNQQEISIVTKGENSAGFFNKDIELSLSVADAPNNDDYSGLKNVTYTLGKDNQNTASNVTAFESTSAALSWDDIKKNHAFETDAIVIDAAQNESNHAFIEVTATDYAGNISTITQELQIDITKPQIEVSFDNNDALNDRYYNRSRVARIDITELNFDPNEVSFVIYKNEKEDTTLVPSVTSWETSAEDVHTTYIIFDQDADYSFEVQCIDLAGNESEKIVTDSFTIDMTKPVAEVAYDNNDAWKDNYFSQARTATITITEHNFDEKDFEAVINPQAALGSWKHEGDIHRITIRFDQEEHYSYTVDYTDLAGNTMDVFEQEEFYIDMNTPVIQIQGVEDKSANAGDVIPVVVVTDGNYDLEGIQINLQNSKGNQIAVTYDVAVKDGGYSYTLTNVNEQPDEIYTLTVNATDLAGNQSDLVYQFSLNRNGSVYDLSQMSAVVEKAYIRYVDFNDLQIYEMNVNTIEEFNIIVTRNGEMITSVESNTRPNNVDTKNIYYATRVEGNDEMGYQYEYTIYRESFEQEGIYNIMFYSKDKAGNEVNNTLTEKKAEITFVVDNSVPTVVVEGVEPGELYTEETKDVNVYVSDNFKLQEAYFNLVDEEGNIIQTYNYMELAKEEGEIITLTLPSTDKKMSIQYYAMDVAGNEITTVQEEEVATSFMITTNTWIRFINNEKAVAGAVCAAAGVVVATGAGIFFRKRRKIKVK